MGTSANRVSQPGALRARITRDQLSVDLDDGRTITAPLAWYPRLVRGTESERNDWRLIGGGHGLHWATLDEDISVEGLLAGTPSGESERSLEDWMHRRR
jgi:Protein of unknown function (DUF2442)